MYQAHTSYRRMTCAELESFLYKLITDHAAKSRTSISINEIMRHVQHVEVQLDEKLLQLVLGSMCQGSAPLLHTTPARVPSPPVPYSPTAPHLLPQPDALSRPLNHPLPDDW